MIHSYWLSIFPIEYQTLKTNYYFPSRIKRPYLEHHHL